MNVVEYLEQKGVSFERVCHKATRGAQQLASGLHLLERQVAKTVLLRADGDYMHIVAIVPADKEVDLNRVSKVFGGSQITLASKAEISECCPHCEYGVLPPFGSRYGMKTIVDDDLAHNEEIVFEGSSHDEAIRMRFDEFQRLECPIIAIIAKT